MVQKILKLQVLMIALLCSISSWAESTTWVKSYYDSDNVTLKYSISYTFDPEDGTNEAYVSASEINSISDIEILSSFEYAGVTYSVTKIGGDAFGGGVFGKVVIPNTVNIIGYQAFRGATISSIEIPNSVTTLGLYCFVEAKISSIKIPNSITTWEEGDYGPFGGSSVEYVELEEGIKYIGVRAFMDCYNLKSIDIPSSVEAIGRSAFQNCKNLVDVNLNFGLKTLEGDGYWGSGPFNGCTSLEQIKLPNSLTTMEWGTFYNCM